MPGYSVHTDSLSTKGSSDTASDLEDGVRFDPYNDKSFVSVGSVSELVCRGCNSLPFAHEF